MNTTTSGLFIKARKAVPTLLILLMSFLSKAQHYDINLPAAPPPTPPEYHFPFNQPIGGGAATIGVQTTAATVVWDFSTIPGGATLESDRFTFRGVTVQLPADASTNVSSAQNVVIEGTPNQTGSFQFSLIVADANNLAVTATGTFEVFIEQAVDVVLVLDRSGSMGAALGAGTRWSALRQSVQNFMLAYETLRPQDRTSVTYYDTDLNPLSAVCPGLISNNSTPALSVQLAGELNSPAYQPHGLTAMGLGLQNAQSKLTDATRSRNILLITDGEQNVNPKVNLNGQGYSDGSSIPDGLRITTIGIGNPSGTVNTTLQNLAQATNGSYNITLDGNAFTFEGGNVLGDLSSGFGNNFMTMLQDNSPQMIDKTSTAIPANNTPVTLQEFPLNKAVNKLLLEFVVPRSFEVPQLAQLLSRIRVTKDGSPVLNYAQPVWSGNYTNTILLVFDFKSRRGSQPPLNPEGKWSVAISDSTLRLGYCKLTSIADDHRLHIKRTWGNKNPKVQDDFPVTVHIDWLGLPVKDAKVDLLVMVPGKDLGQLLSEAANVQLSDSADAGSPGVQKFNHLLATDSSFRKALEATGTLVTLTQTGNGKYEGAFKNLPVAGMYRLVYRISSKDSAAGEFQRFVSESFYTSFSNVDLTKSNVTTVINDGQLVMNLKPITSYGVLIGPAMGSAFSVTNPAIKIANVVDHQDGSYTITFEGNINDTTSIQILGQTVHTGKLQDAGKGGSVIDKLHDWLRDHGIPVWLFWLVLLLLLILILWFIFRKKN
jgi:von Willebrand factor type A domain.